MPKDNLSANRPNGIELLETEPRPELGEPRAGAARQIITIVGLAVMVGLGLTLLPDAPMDTDLESTLPAPVIATTVAQPEPVPIGLIGLDAFPLQFEPTLEGYVRLAGPAFGNGTYWLIGTGKQPTLLNSSDGVAWSQAGPFPADDDRLVDIHQLIGDEGVLIAVGTEASRNLEEDPLQRLQVWRSADGITWIPEEVASGATFLDSNVTVDRNQQIVVTASDAIGHDRLYRSSFFGLWQEIAITFSTANGIIRAPDGGFLVSTREGSIVTSPNGVNWVSNPKFDTGIYSQWNDEIVGTYHESGQLTMRVLGEEGVSVTELPDTLEGCQVRGGPAGLLAICPSESGSAFNLYLSENGLLWERSQSAILTDEIIYLGYTNAGFLIATEGIDGTLLVARAALP